MQPASNLPETILTLMAIALCLVVPLGIGIGAYVIRRRRARRDY